MSYMWITTPSSNDRRVERRLSTQMFLNEYVDDDGRRSLVRDLSVRGVRLQRLAAPQPKDRRAVGLEIVLPGISEVIWARAEPRFDLLESDFHWRGLMFAGMARKHMRLLGEFVYEQAQARAAFARALQRH